MSILHGHILDRVENQVNEDWFRNQLIQELGSTNFDDDAADTNGFDPGNYIFLHIKHKQNNHIMTCIHSLI